MTPRSCNRLSRLHRAILPPLGVDADALALTCVASAALVGWVGVVLFLCSALFVVAGAVEGAGES